MLNDAAALRYIQNQIFQLTANDALMSPTEHFKSLEWPNRLLLAPKGVSHSDSNHSDFTKIVWKQ